MQDRVRSSTPLSQRTRDQAKLDLRVLSQWLLSIAQAFLVFFVIGYFIWRGAQAMEYNWQWYRVEPFFYRVIDGEVIYGPLIRGLIQTLMLAAIAGVFAILIGFVTALARLSNSIAGRIIAKWYLEAIRNTPLLVQLFLFYFVGLLYVLFVLGCVLFFVLGFVCFELLFASRTNL